MRFVLLNRSSQLRDAVFGAYKEEITTSAEQFKKLSKAVAVMSDHAKETFVSTKTAHKVQYNRLYNEKIIM